MSQTANIPTPTAVAGVPDVPPPPGGGSKVVARQKPRQGVTGWVRRGGIGTLLFFVPLLLSFGLFSWWPIVRSLLLSIQQTNFVTSEWVGLANFEAVLRDPLLMTATLNTLWFVVLGVIIGFPLPVLLAVCIAELRKTKPIASVLAYLPVIVPPVVAVLLWKEFYEPSERGLFNTIGGWFGLPALRWLNDGDLVIPAIVVQATWASMGTAVIVYIATLMSIRTELYEAAEVDGATLRQRFWHVTLPQLRGVMLVMLLLQLIGTFQVFTEPYIMTGGGPENRSITILMLIYRYAFISGDYGRATALSLLLAVALALLSAVYFWATRRWNS